MQKYKILIIDDELSERRETYYKFLNEEIGGVNTSFDIIEAEIPDELDDVLSKEADSIDAIFMDALFDEDSWYSVGRNSTVVLKDLEKAYENSRIPPCFVVSKHWGDAQLLSNISSNFASIHQLIHPSKYYRVEDLEAIYQNAMTSDRKGKRLQQERNYIKSEIEKSRKEKSNTIIPVDAVLVFAVPDEKSAMYRRLGIKAENDRTLKKYGIFYQEATIDDRHVVLVSQVEMGMTDAARVTTAALIAFKPKIVIMVGICAGEKSKMKLGDLVVVSDAYDYAIGKLKKQKSETGEESNVLLHRSYHSRVDTNLDKFLNLLRDPGFARREMFEISEDYIGEKVSPSETPLHVAAMASGPWVVDTPEVFSDIGKAINTNIYSLDMEAYGVAHAADELKTPWLIVKSVQDYANGKKSADEKKIRPFASFCSAFFVYRNLDRILKSIEEE